jgi:hypothetical protein
MSIAEKDSAAQTAFSSAGFKKAITLTVLRRISERGHSKSGRFFRGAKNG